MTVRSLTPLRRISSINVSGMPQRPKPPAAIVIPSKSRPARASLDVSWNFFAMVPTSQAAEKVPAVDLDDRAGHVGGGIGGKEEERRVEVGKASKAALGDALDHGLAGIGDRKSTSMNSSH